MSPSPSAPMNCLAGFPSLKAITVGNERIWWTCMKHERLKSEAGDNTATNLILLGEFMFLVSVYGNQVERTSGPSFDGGVSSKPLQYGRDHLAWSAPTEPQILSDPATPVHIVTNSA